MAQTSYPQGGYYDTVTLPDSGPYAAIEWNGLLGLLQRAGVVVTGAPLLQVDTAFNDVGVFYCAGNRLEVTNPGAAANTIQIDTGACMTGGVLHANNAAVTFTVPNNRTNDLIVVRQNFSAGTYTPPGSVDADEQVPPDTARITRVTALVNDATLATYWDIPLADFTTDGAGAVTINSDDRVWIDAETKKLFVPCVGGWNQTLASSLEISSQLGFTLPDNNIASGFGYWIVSGDFIASLNSYAVVVPLATGNVYSTQTAVWGECGQQYNTHTSVPALSAVAVTLNEIECIRQLSPSPVVDGDIIALTYRRDATNILDTIGDSVCLRGFYVEYLGWNRR